MINKKTGLLVGVTGALAVAVVVSATVINQDSTTPAPDRIVSFSDALAITVYKNENCSCCEAWAQYLENNGFQVDVVVTNSMNEVKLKYGVPREVQSCHTAVMGDLVIEGHVPVQDILAFNEQPTFNMKGLSVPGMVQGSPGMETGTKQDYSVVAFSANGQTSVFRTGRPFSTGSSI